jgi:hypothetical protein
MAETTLADFKLYPVQVQSGMNEVLQQNANAFNGASNNTIRLYPQALTAQYGYEAFFQSIGSTLVARRDSASLSSVADQELTQDEQISVKLDRRVGPIKMTDDAFKKIGRDPELASFIIGQQAGVAITLDYLNTGLKALVAAIRVQSAQEVDKSDESTATITHGYLVDTLKPMGDAGNRIVAWVMHSKVFYDLMGQAISDKITNVAATVIYGGSPGTLGRPVVVTDSSALYLSTDSPDEYVTLGLTQGALDIIQSEPASMVNDLITGEQNLAQRIQGEHAFNVKVKGAKWDVSNGGVNPTDATLATGSNWDKICADLKDYAGTALVTQ